MLCGCCESLGPTTRWLSSHQKLRCQHLPMVSISPKLFPSQNLLVYLLSRLFSITSAADEPRVAVEEYFSRVEVEQYFSQMYTRASPRPGQADQLESRCQLSIPRRQLAANTTIIESPSGHLRESESKTYSLLYHLFVHYKFTTMDASCARQQQLL